MNANIDKAACTGCELCVKACSDVFQMENGKAMVVASYISRNVESICRQTAKDCPSSAIHIGEATGLMLTGGYSQKRSWLAL
jgi:ferredoxin